MAKKFFNVWVDIDMSCSVEVLAESEQEAKVIGEAKAMREAYALVRNGYAVGARAYDVEALDTDDLNEV